MASIPARLINRYMRTSMKRLPLAEMEAGKVREIFESRTINLYPKSVTREILSDGPVKGEWNRPQSPRSDRVIYYLHGGGYVFGSSAMYASFTTRLAKAADAPVFSLDYRLSPEHVCPAAIEDALAGWNMLLAQGVDPKSIYVGGDSAGGGLTLALLHALKAEGRDLPGGVFLYSPWADLTSSGASITENAEADAMFHPETFTSAVRYAGDLPLSDQRVSPLFGEFDGLPPMLVFVSNDEMLRDDSVRIAEKVSASGGVVDLQREDGLIHVWPIFTPFMPEANAAIKKTAAFINRTA